MQLKVGEIVEGTVKSLTKFGAFVALEGGRSGLVHISEIAPTYVNDVHDFLQEGQTVKVKVIGIKDGKISLSMKALDDVAAVEVEEETYEMPETEAATTSLACLFKNIKLS